MELNYKRIGSGQPLVILHGLFGSLDNWQRLAKQFAVADLDVISVDLRNHGKSPHSDLFNLRVMADDVRDLVVSLSLENIVLLGHSMGGKVAMTVAANYPELLSKLIVVDIAPKEYPSGHQLYFDAMQQLDIAGLSSRKEADTAFSLHIDNVAIRQFLLKNLQREESGFSWKFNLDVIQDNYTEILKEIELQEKFNNDTLFLRGDNSGYIKDEDLTKILSKFPKAELETIANSGHWIHAEQPRDFYEKVQSFIFR